MLVDLSIRDVVLIDRLELAFRPGLGVLTGETGAGKSILLDALGLALGARGDSGLVRHGASQASVAASFSVPPDHPVMDAIEGHGLPVEQPLVLRRVLTADGRSRAFVNDQATGVAFLRRIGDALVEIQGQYAQRGLLDPATHRAVLDAYGGHQRERARVREAFEAWQAAAAAQREAEAALARARADEAFLQHAVQELDALDPAIGEEATLGTRRAVMKHREKLTEAMQIAFDQLLGGHGADQSLRTASRSLARVADKAGGRLEPVLAGLDRAIEGLADAVADLEALGREFGDDPGALERLEDRLFALREVARKHRCSVDELPALRQDFDRRLAALDEQDGDLGRRRHEAEAARQDFEAAAGELSTARAAAAAAMDGAVAAELPPLHLEKARFRTRIDAVEERNWSAEGWDSVAFEVTTNPGTPFGPLARVASGGELSRFMLALKVCLSKADGSTTLIFDEVDSGIGGAAAAAVGERLARLGADTQVLVVTHSPQVAARGGAHWRVAKTESDAGAVTAVDELDEAARREEIARMLSGSRITEEARAAARSLIADDRAAGPGR